MKCPTCSRAIEWNDSFPLRPFCSERCRMVDLGAWLSESHAIPGEPVDELELRDAPAPRDRGSLS
ncbi:MAG: DNA gyrase inhibitor YacG [Gammaproteobacteria bacterium]|jgi:hypothetical protein|nr:DNA gyrase inhibitor YacG [Gammaproteobacteria bacterium]